MPTKRQRPHNSDDYDSNRTRNGQRGRFDRTRKRCIPSARHVAGVAFVIRFRVARRRRFGANQTHGQGRSERRAEHGAHGAQGRSVGRQSRNRGQNIPDQTAREVFARVGQTVGF